MAKASNAWLRRQFKRINKEFFGNRLDPNTRVRFGTSKYLGEAGFMEFTMPGKRKHTRSYPDILINNRLKWSQALSGPTLVHEMVHVENPQWTKHRGKFDRRLERLVCQGAMRLWL